MNADLATVVRAALRAHVPRGARMVIGLSGGIDSVVLLHVLVRALRLSPQRISAIHVNHQLSPHAAQWAAFCRRRCRELGIRLRVARVDVRRGNSTEAAAREARRAVFAVSGADVILLAHNRDDQAETLLLQLLRGAGPRGLAAMPQYRPAEPPLPALLRPLLDVPRSAIEAYARRHRLQWVEDDSNADRSYLRNFLRHDVLPLIERRLPCAGVTLARAARHQAEASELLDVLARIDLGDGLERGVLQLAVLRALPAQRARNALRYFLRSNGLPMPDAVRLGELLRQALTARGDSALRLRIAGADLRRFRDALHVVRPLPADRVYAKSWNGRGSLRLEPLAGVLRLERTREGGIDAALLRGARIEIRVRRGGESLRLSERGRRRTMRNLLQEADLPPWVRERLPFIYLNGVLAAVADIGIDTRFRARPGRPGLLPVWRPD